jgi:hypothetical protein
MNIDYSELLFVAQYYNIELNPEAFYDKSQAKFVKLLNSKEKNVLQELETFGDISPKPISIEAFNSKYNHMLFTKAVNDKVEKLQGALMMQEWDTLTTEFPDLAGVARSDSKLVTADEISIETSSFTPFYPEWDLVYRGLLPEDFIVIFGINKRGKLLADGTPILTPQGWTTHGELKVGDYVYGLDGKAIKILNIMNRAEANMRVEMSNGEIIYCHEDHEWTIKNHHGAIKTWETSKIKKYLETTRESIYLPQADYIQSERKELPLDPYFLDKTKQVTIKSVIYDNQGYMGHCIEVDSPDGLYRVGRTLVPTHNSTFTANIAYQAIKHGHTIGFYPTELSISVTLKYILGFEFGLKGNEALEFFNKYPQEFDKLRKKYGKQIIFPPTHIFSWEHYEALYKDSRVQIVFQDNFVRCIAQLGLSEDAVSASQLARKFSTVQQRYRKSTFMVTQETVRPATPKELEDNPGVYEVGQGYTFMTKSMMQETSLGINIVLKSGTTIREIRTTADRFRGSGDGNTIMSIELDSQSNMRTDMVKSSIDKAIQRAEKMLKKS